MDYREATDHLSEIRWRLAQHTLFRGYRSLTIGATGVIALLAAVGQAYLAPAPVQQLDRYLQLWVGVAAISLIVAVGELLWESARQSTTTHQANFVAIESFLPCLVVGALLTAAIYRYAVDAAWLLPGMWSAVFSLGIFASHRLLPRQILWVAFYYLACGLGCLCCGPQANPLAPWRMAVSFGGGQLLTAAILYWQLERTDGE